jgi:DNA-binding NarL/FixJ family response regulator
MTCPRCGGLSPRERQVLTLAARGLTNRAIGMELGISPWTVREHLGSAYRRLGVDCRTAAVVVAWQRGLIELDKDKEGKQ